MPQGPGTYGSKKGRPKKVRSAKIGRMFGKLFKRKGTAHASPSSSQVTGDPRDKLLDYFKTKFGHKARPMHAQKGKFTAPGPHKKPTYMTEAQLEKTYPSLARGEMYHPEEEKAMKRRKKKGEKKIKGRQAGGMISVSEYVEDII